MRKLSILVFMILLISPLTGCFDSSHETSPLRLEVIPQQLNGFSIAGQQCVFLVWIDDQEASNTATELSAKANGQEVPVYPQAILRGEIAEVTVIPQKENVGKTIDLSVTGQRGTASETRVITFEVVEGEDDREEYVLELRDRFVACLEHAQPELTITQSTEWTGTIVSPQWLVVAHYLFFSSEWEMHLSWHIMIPPHDWAKIDLRHRYDETIPSYAFGILSLQAGNQPQPVEPPATLWR